MKKFKGTKKILALLLSLSLITGMMPATAWNAFAAEAQADGTTYVLAGSDFQAKSGHDEGVRLVSGLLTPIQNDYPTMDGFLFAGDYDVNYNSSVEGKTKLQQTVQGVYGNEMHEVYVEGNHDSDNSNFAASPSGANDADDYGVFVINESDYMWHNDDENTVKRTAENLESYLNVKRNTDYTKPIFVVSHLALNYSMRTNNDGDGKYAYYIFDVLNEAAAAGLNIIYLYGHNHSNGWDDYLGGAAVFLKAGDKINICQGNQSTFKEETLAFTYMNAGYVGYYTSNSSVDKTLTMTTFEITNDDVKINRYDANGKHNLKSQGYSNKNYDDSNRYSPNTSTVPSPYTLTLNKDITSTGEEITPPNAPGSGNDRTYTRVTNISELVSGGKYLIIENASTDYFMLPESVSKESGTRVGYNIESTTVAGGNTITGDYSTKEWTMTGSDTQWVLSTPAGSAYMEYQNDSRAYGRISSSNSSTFTIGGSADSYTFSTTVNGKNYVFDHSSAGLINGYVKTPDTEFYIYRLTNAGSGTPTVDATGGSWVTVTAPGAGTTTYTYELTDTIESGKNYLIGSSNNGNVNILNSTGSPISGTTTDKVFTTTSSVSDAYKWTFTGSGTSYTIKNLSSGGYLYPTARYAGKSWSYSLEKAGNNTSVNVENNSGALTIWLAVTDKKGGETKSYMTNGFSAANTGSSVYLYGISEETSAGTPGIYGKIEGELTYDVAIGTSREDALAAVKAGISAYEYEAMAKPGADVTGEPINDNDLEWILDPNYDGTSPGEFAVTIKYNGVRLGVAKVVVPSVAVKSYSVEPAYGVVYKGTSQQTATGSYIYVQLEDGKFYKVPVTVNMLTKSDGSNVSTGVETTYEGLTLTYNGRVLTNNYTLKVVLKDGNNYPEYPDEGAVKVNKTATGVDFQSSGVAKVELTASGVPVKKGADVIIMLDTSSSMDNKVDVNGVAMSRLNIMKTALKNMVTQFKEPGQDGELSDIRVAVADFNCYYTDSSSPYYIDSKDHLAGGTIRGNTGTNYVYTGNESLSAGAFENVQNINVAEFDKISYQSGTNYDYAMDAIYQLGSAITTDNASKGLERDLFVVFMSDGAPFQYNYFSAQSSGTNASYWNNWLQGTLTDEMKDADARNDYYNEDGKHWMAEAIKGNPEEFYPVIRKNDPTDTNGDNWVDVQGLGATVYSIGFCLETDQSITVDSMESALQSIATSSKGTYYRTNTYEGLNSVFTSIGSAIAYAATEARFVDTMGSAFDLQIGDHTYLPKGETDESKMQTISPTIEVRTYDIYTAAEVDGTTITEDMIGKRKGTSTLNEEVTFNADGSEAYSSELPDVNILDTNGIIDAKTFWYNTGSSAQMIDTNGDGTADYKLAPETFYWNIDTIKTQEVALSYYVYLTGALEGTREAGSYKTNESAILYYTNYLGKEHCEKVTTSPVIGWESANVSYAFYLVNELGEVVVNQTTGETGTFANKIAVTSPVVYKEVTLNDAGTTVEPMEVAATGVLPEGYEVYDGSAVYKVTANSNETGNWIINKGDGKAQSTYVTNFGGSSQYSNELTMDVPTNDYTHTVVWFAVVWKTRTIDDAVVIDYGLPVDINVLGNDMFGDHGKLNAVGAAIPPSISRALYLAESDFANAKTLETAYGDVEVVGNEARYTPKNMSMDQKDTFAYEVNYIGTKNPGYYYGEVTVIPATTIYYEDNFVDFTSYTKAEGSTEYTKDIVAKWSMEGQTKEATQDEDRPGTYNLPTVDANNLYGYDSAYTDASTYSLGSAMKIDVTQNVRGEAEFDFMGTGFDIIGLTSNTTGTLIVQVVDETGATVRSSVVDTYYGYAYENGEWVTVDSNSPNALYQIPVMKIFGLDYGKYTVKLIAGYNSYFDRTGDTNGDYTLYIDAIRVYDPANGGAGDAVIKDAYAADKEDLPKYFEVRDKLIKPDEYNSLGNAESINGIVFIDGVGETANVADYTAYGPNNEVYLQHGQAITFDLDASATGYKVESVQLGLKTVAGEGAVEVYGVQTDASGKATTTSCLNKTISTATDMYYDITSLDSKTVVIKNSGSDTSATISVTNVKVTYSQAIERQSTPEQGVFMLRRASVENAITTLSRAANTPDVPVTPEEPVEPDTPVVPEEPDTPENPDTPVVPDEPETPVVPENPVTPEKPEDDKPGADKPEKPVVTAAKIVSVKTDKQVYTQGDKVKVTVTTNSAATKIKVGTKTLKTFKATNGNRTWTTTVNASKIGKLTINAVAYNKNGAATKKVTKTVTVKKYAPKIFKVSLNKTKVKVGAKYTVTVKAGSTVKHVRVNGKKITKFTTKNGVKTFKVTLKATKVGKQKVKVVAYNKALYPTNPKFKTVTVKRK